MASKARFFTLVAIAACLCVATAKEDWSAVGNKAIRDFSSGRLDDALVGFRKMQKMQPKNMEVWIASAQVLQQQGKLNEALQEFSKALEVDGGYGPRAWEVYMKMGELLQSAGDWQQAREAFDQATAAAPHEASAWVTKGNLHQQSDNYRQAMKDFKKASELAPREPNGWSGLGVSYMYMEHVDPGGAPEGFGSYDEASIDALRRTMELSPTNMHVLSNLVMAENRVCDWSMRKKHIKQLRKALRDSAARKENFAPPFHAFEFGYGPKEILVNAKYLARRIWNDATTERERIGKVMKKKGAPEIGKDGRLSIAYVNGAGFHNGTTTARCLQSMFGMHDKKRFKVHCLPMSGDDKSPERAKIRDGCDEWIEGANFTGADVADTLSNMRPHILVDTTGYTMKQRTEVLALEVAPIVVSFHGFPGTMAATFVHYLTADRLTTPPEHQGYYAEKLVILPNTYLINDHRQSRREVLGEGGMKPSRKELGFSYGDIVLASFNQLYKIDPAIFEAWMTILKEVPKAKIWMLRFSHAAEHYLRREAEKHGIDGNRIGFSDKFPKETELLSKGTANLFLDTPLFNAHTTGGDVLWAGVPIVTMPGENFASRVASGLIDSTTSLPSMTIARTVEDYAQLVIQMCKSQELGNMKRALESERETAPVFDTKRLTGEFETSMRLMWDIYAAGLDPMHIVVRSR